MITARACITEDHGFCWSQRGPWVEVRPRAATFCGSSPFSSYFVGCSKSLGADLVTQKESATLTICIHYSKLAHPKEPKPHVTSEFSITFISVVRSIKIMAQALSAAHDAPPPFTKAIRTHILYTAAYQLKHLTWL